MLENFMFFLNSSTYNSLGFLGIALLIGFVFGKIFERINLPSITGYIVAGILIGPVLGLVSTEYQNFVSESEEYLEIISKITIGFIAFSIGSELWLPKFKGYGKKIIIITLFQAILTFILVTGLVLMFKQPIWLALTLGSIATATAPAPILLIVKNYKARGKITDTLIPVTGLDDAVGIIIFGIAHALATSLATGADLNIYDALIGPIIEILVSIAIGVLIGVILGLANNFIFSRYDKEQANASILTFILIVVFASVILSNKPIVLHFPKVVELEISSILMPMASGFVYTNMINKSSYKKQVSAIDNFTPPLMIAFFTLAGASLNLSVISSLDVILVALIYFVGRSLGKIFGAYLGASVAKAPKVIKHNLGFALLPQGGVEIGLVITASTIFIDLENSGFFADASQKPSDIITTVVIIGIFIFELIGPILTKYILNKNKELHYKDDLSESMHF